MKCLELLQLLISFTLCLLIFGNIQEAESSRNIDIRNHVKLFVFGDSYADTGNTARPISKTTSSPWTVPYGITYPHRPDGRFSDGFVFSDFIARHIGIMSPVTYKRWKINHGRNTLKYGMNFAYGGTGVFDTSAPYPNMTAQIHLFEQLVKQNVFTSRDLENSLVQVQLSGNDYSFYASQHPNLDGIAVFVEEVVAQLVSNIRSIYSIGVKQVLVSGLQPLGCLPDSTRSTNYTECSSVANSAVKFHNSLLQQAVASLNNQTTIKGRSYTPFIFLDLYDSFMAVINNQTRLAPGEFKFGNPLEPCCIGVNTSYSCASSAEDGKKLYTLCNDRRARFFWDSFHPTNEGWLVLSTLLLNHSLDQLLHISH
ncbi:hypothetical protein Dimus_007021 [Dionaea muscipula]